MSSPSAGPASDGAPRFREQAPYSLRELVLYMLKLGSVGFGGPVALVGYMYRDLAEQRSWFTDAEYKEGLTLSQIAPGPLAAQLAIYLGFCHYRLRGATLAGAAFVLPSFVMVVALGWAYMRYGSLWWLQAVFYGVGACIIGIIARSAQKLVTKTVGRDRILLAVFGVVALNTVVTEYESIPLIVYAGLLLWALRRGERGAAPIPIHHPARLAQIVLVSLGALALTLYAFFPSMFAGAAPGFGFTLAPQAASGEGVLWDILWYFGAAGAFVFGSGLAIVPFLFGGVVKGFGWLTDQQFLDAVAVALITPGPVVITTGFIGYLVAGFAGASVAAFATFFPCYLFTVIPAPFMRRYGTSPAILAAVDGITAATAGAIAGAVIVLGKRSVVDWPTAAIALGTYLILARTGKIPEPALVVAAGILGLALHPLMV